MEYNRRNERDVGTLARVQARSVLNFFQWLLKLRWRHLASVPFLSASFQPPTLLVISLAFSSLPSANSFLWERLSFFFRQATFVTFWAISVLLLSHPLIVHPSSFRAPFRNHRLYQILITFLCHSHIYPTSVALYYFSLLYIQFFFILRLLYLVYSCLTVLQMT